MVPSFPSLWTSPKPNTTAKTLLGQAQHTETQETFFVAQLLSKKHCVTLVPQKDLLEGDYQQIEATRKNPITFAMDGLPSPAGIYRHFKGPEKLYEVYGIAMLYTTPHVLYCPLYGDHEGLLYARPYATSRGAFLDSKGYGFFDWVYTSQNELGYAGPRFTYMNPMETSMHPLLYKPFNPD
jgi:hypothetical protein